MGRSAGNGGLPCVQRAVGDTKCEEKWRDGWHWTSRFYQIRVNEGVPVLAICFFSTAVNAYSLLMRSLTVAKERLHANYFVQSLALKRFLIPFVQHSRVSRYLQPT